MKKKIIVLNLLLYICYSAKSQENLIQKFQGNWIGQISSPVDSKTVFISVIKNYDKLTLMFNNSEIVHISKTKIGFIETTKDSLTTKDLSESGSILCNCAEDANKYFKNCLFIADFDGSGDYYSYGKTTIYDFAKTVNLPKKLIADILKSNKVVDFEQIKYFFNYDIKKILVNKSIIYNLSKIKTKKYLLLGDKIELLETQENWLKVRYYGKKNMNSKVIEGWIKQTDVK